MNSITAKRRKLGTTLLWASTLTAFGALFMMASCRDVRAQVITNQCSWGKRDVACTTSVIPPGVFAPQVQHVRQPTPGSEAEKAQQERIDAWERRCVSHVEIDDLGVSRYVYKHAGCEYGK